MKQTTTTKQNTGGWNNQEKSRLEFLLNMLQHFNPRLNQCLWTNMDDRKAQFQLSAVQLALTQ